MKFINIIYAGVTLGMSETVKNTVTSSLVKGSDLTSSETVVSETTGVDMEFSSNPVHLGSKTASTMPSKE